MKERSDGGGGPPAWERISSEPLGDFDMFRVRRDRARSPRDGSVHEFNIAESPDGVTLVALTPERELVLVEQFRHPHREVTLETPSGIIDDGESPVEAGLRELREETGFEGEGAEVIGTVALNPSWQTTRVHVVVARDVRREQAADPDPGEDLRIRLVPLDEVRERILRGEITSCVAVAAVALFGWRETGSGR
ncbi:MAG TPA: NUDIX hydrolase [Longimicrobiaceae bacterium]|nr:NUDIX hydrolase [Longimicrobiaceae bacterium]